MIHWCPSFQFQCNYQNCFQSHHLIRPNIRSRCRDYLLYLELSQLSLSLCEQNILVHSPSCQRAQLFVRQLTRPEKSLHFLVRSPDSNLHFLVSPEIALHLITG